MLGRETVYVLEPIRVAFSFSISPIHLSDTFYTIYSYESYILHLGLARMLHSSQENLPYSGVHWHTPDGEGFVSSTVTRIVNK